jgi:hypothetical protein
VRLGWSELSSAGGGITAAAGEVSQSELSGRPGRDSWGRWSRYPNEHLGSILQRINLRLIHSDSTVRSSVAQSLGLVKKKSQMSLELSR